MSTEYWTASSDMRVLGTDDRDVRSRPTTVTRLPAGVIHAYVEGSARTICGLPLARLLIWPEVQFPVLAYPDKCERCASLADPVVVNTRWRNAYLAA